MHCITFKKGTCFGSIFLHYQTNSLEQPEQATYPLDQTLPVLRRGQVRLAVPLHGHAVADDEVAAVQGADVDGRGTSLTQAGHQLHAAADAAAVHQDAGGPGPRARLFH